MNKLIFLLAAMAAACFASCTKMKCDNRELRFCLTGYSAEEASYVIKRTYEKGNDFKDLVGEVNVPFDGQCTGALVDGYDYKIEVPQAGRTYTLTGIAFSTKDELHYTETAGGCSNGVSYFLDGKEYVLPAVMGEHCIQMRKE